VDMKLEILEHIAKSLLRPVKACSRPTRAMLAAKNGLTLWV